MAYFNLEEELKSQPEREQETALGNFIGKG